MKVAVIGGGGFIGINLCEALVSQGHAVRVFDRPRAKHTFPSNIARQVEWFEGDFLNSNDVSEPIRGCEVLFHLACTTLPRSSNENPVYDAESNIVASINMLEVAKRLGVRKVVFNSSGGTVYGIPEIIPIPETHKTDPLCAYGISKLAIEKYLALFSRRDGLDYIIIRMSNPYGPYQQPCADQGAIAVFLNKALNGDTIEIWGDGTVTRDFIYIKDAVDALVQILNYEGNEHIFNVGSGEGHSLNDIIDLMESVLEYRVKRRYMQRRALDVPINLLDISRIQNELGWEPKTTLMDGMQYTLNYLQRS